MPRWLARTSTFSARSPFAWTKVERRKDQGSGVNTTIAIVATDARLNRGEAKRLAMMASNGMPRALRPIHTPFDGDTVFSVATGRVELPEPRALSIAALGALAGLQRRLVEGDQDWGRSSCRSLERPPGKRRRWRLVPVLAASRGLPKLVAELVGARDRRARGAGADEAAVEVRNENRAADLVGTGHEPDRATGYRVPKRPFEVVVIVVARR